MFSLGKVQGPPAVHQHHLFDNRQPVALPGTPHGRSHALGHGPRADAAASFHRACSGLEWVLVGSFVAQELEHESVRMNEHGKQAGHTAPWKV
jgi:hypothetical protein